MFIRIWVCGIAVVACLIAAAPGAAQRGTNHAPAFTVGSTLTGKTVLAHRAHWVANPSLAEGKIREVDFLIDGKLHWIEHHRPYIYGGLDGNNYLVTSWLKPGMHRFTVRAKAANGKTAQRTTIARVLPAVPPPAPLAATWQRVVTQEQAGSETPAGTWVISVDEVGWSIKDPHGYDNWIDAAYPADGRVQLRGGIWTNPSSNTKQGGNGWCQDTNVPVDYSWAVSGDTLMITHNGADSCGTPNNFESQIVAGAWTRLR